MVDGRILFHYFIGTLTKRFLKPLSPNLRYPLFYAFLEGGQANLHVPPIGIQYKG